MKNIGVYDPKNAQGWLQEQKDYLSGWHTEIAKLLKWIESQGDEITMDQVRSYEGMFDCASPFLATANGQVYNDIRIEDRGKWSCQDNRRTEQPYFVLEKMGILSEVVVTRTYDNVSFKGHSWTREDGSFEAFWYEDGNRLTMFFDCNGLQKGAWKKYRIQFRG